jgi:hypothetical protein
MKNIKTFEGFLDFFKKEQSEDDKIALEYIKRLKRVTGLSPYKITLEEGPLRRNNRCVYKVNTWKVEFEDTPVKLWEVISTNNQSFEEGDKAILLNKKFTKISNREFIGINVFCEGDAEQCNPSAKIAKELLDLIKSVYEKDKEIKRIERINVNINPAADKLDPDMGY